MIRYLSAILLLTAIAACGEGAKSAPASAGKNAENAGSIAVDDATDGPADAPTAGDDAAAADKAGAADAVVAAAIDAGTARMAPAAADAAADAAPDAAAPTPSAATIPAAQALSGLQYNGGVAFTRTLPSGGSEFVEISAPLLPSTQVLYGYEAANFPPSFAAMEAVALSAALVYDDLLLECAKDNPTITLQAAGATQALTEAQLAANFNAVAECSYIKYFAKPYWIPKLVDDVDICALKLGADWRMLNEADLDELTADELKLINAALTPQSGAWWGTFYFSLNVYLRLDSGSLALSPIANPPVLTTIEQAGASWYTDETKWLTHLEGNWVLRCRRARTVLSL